MPQTQSIIVYRNPVEKALFEGELSFLAYGAGVFLLTLYVLDWASRKSRVDVSGRVLTALAAMAGIATCWATLTK